MNVLEIIKQLLTEDFCKFLFALSAIMFANAVTGAMKAFKEHRFSWKELGMGLLSYFVWAVGASLTVAGLQIYGGELEVTIGSTTMTLISAIEIAKKGVYLYWSAKAIQNFVEYGKIDTKVVPVMPAELEDFAEYEVIDNDNKEE